jgi:hypothetical protein
VVGCGDPLGGRGGSNEGEREELWFFLLRIWTFGSTVRRLVTVGKFIPLWFQRYIKCSTTAPRRGTAAPIKTTLLDVKFCWLFWLSMRMWFSEFEHLVQQLDSCTWIPLYSTAFLKLNVQNIKIIKPSWVKIAIKWIWGILQPIHHPLFKLPAYHLDESH